MGVASEVTRRPPPERPLGESAALYFGLHGAGGALLALIVSLFVASALSDEGRPWRTLARLLVLGVVVAGAVAVFVVPLLRVRRWRWALRDEVLDLRHGAITERRTIVPMARVQHVEVRRTTLGRMLGVSAVAVHTAAGTVEIPALSEPEALYVRDRIADLARTPDDL